MKKYVIIQWPEIQDLMYYEDFDDHACLINDDNWLDKYGSSAYFVEENWLNRLKLC